MTTQHIYPADQSFRMMQTVKTRILVIMEILAVFAILVVFRAALTPSRIVQWELHNLKWSYTIMLLFVAITALVIVLTRRKWEEYGLSGANWQTNLDIGMKPYLVLSSRWVSVGDALHGWGLILTTSAGVDTSP